MGNTKLHLTIKHHCLFQDLSEKASKPFDEIKSCLKSSIKVDKLIYRGNFIDFTVML